MPHMAVQTVIRPCGVKPTPNSSGWSTPPDIAFDTPVSIYIYFNLICYNSCSNSKSQLLPMCAAREVGADAGVCRSRCHCPVGDCFCFSCCQTCGL